MPTTPALTQLADKLPARLRRLPVMTRVLGEVEPRVLLELELGRGVVEAPPSSPLEALRSLRRPTLRVLVEALEQAATDDEVAGVVAHLGTWAPTLAQSAELRAAVTRLSTAGKATVVWAEAYGELGPGNTAYHLASAFEDVWLQPSGDVGLVGFTAQATFLRGALDKLGVEPEIGQRHEFKSAADTFNQTSMTAPVREMMTRIVESSTQTLVADVAAGRGLDAEAVRSALEEGPLTSDRALELGLVDRLGYRDEVYAALGVEDRELVFVDRYAGSGGLAAALGGVSRPRSTGSGKPVVAVVGAHGAITLGRSSGGGPLPTSSPSVGSETLSAALRAAGREERVRAVVLRVDSPGGSYSASDTVRREVLRLREQGTPVVASMGSVAASGGYFIAMPCDRVLAGAGTLTGSIGVLAGKQVLRGLLEKVGIARETVSVGRYADMFDSGRGFDEQEWARLEGWLDRVYDDFTTKAAQDRGMEVEALREVAKGRVWTGADAVGIGLVDQIGGLSAAVDEACRIAGIERGDATVSTFPRSNPLAGLTPARNSESPAAARADGIGGIGGLGDGPALLQRLLGDLGLPAGGVLTTGLKLRLR